MIKSKSRYLKIKPEAAKRIFQARMSFESVKPRTKQQKELAEKRIARARAFAQSIRSK